MEIFLEEAERIKYLCQAQWPNFTKIIANFSDIGLVHTYKISDWRIYIEYFDGFCQLILTYEIEEWAEK